MKSKLFGRTNINDILFNVETQEGSEILEGDDAVASIGDATLAHVQGLTSLGRMAWDEHIQMPDGNIFRTEDNPRWDDPDEFNLASKDELQRFMQFNKVPEKMRTVYEEALGRVQADEESDDVMDHPEELIPYEDWEKFGGMSKFWDIPPTPKPKLVFCGNSRSPFYDEWPEGHPLSGFVERVLNTLDRYEERQILTRDQILEHNQDAKGMKHAREIFHPTNLQPRDPRDPDSPMMDVTPAYHYVDGKDEYLLAEAYVNTVAKSIMSESVPMIYRVHTFDVLKEMVMSIATAKDRDPVESVKIALREMDRFHFTAYKAVVIKKTTEEDPLYIHLCNIGKRAIQMAKKGRDTYNEIKKIGLDLFEKGFVAEVLVHAGDLCGDECGMPRGRKPGDTCGQDLAGHGLDGKVTRVVHPSKHHWQKYRAIKTELERLRAMKTVSKPSEAAQACIDRIEKARAEAIKGKNLRTFTKLANELMQAQKTGSLKLVQRERELVWGVYNTAKQELTQSIKEQVQTA